MYTPTLSKLERAGHCAITDYDDVACAQEAFWAIDGIPVCQEDIRAMADMNSDNEEFLRPAIEEKALR